MPQAFLQSSGRGAFRTEPYQSRLDIFCRKSFWTEAFPCMVVVCALRRCPTLRTALRLALRSKRVCCCRSAWQFLAARSAGWER